jgi:hypothetical protein
LLALQCGEGWPVGGVDGVFEEASVAGVVMAFTEALGLLIDADTQGGEIAPERAIGVRGGPTLGS